MRQFFGQGQSDAAGTGADINDSQEVGGRGRPPHTDAFQHGFDHVLGFRAGNEHGWRHDKVHAPEFLVAGNVLGGHAAFAFGQGVVIPILFVRGELAFGVSVEISAVASRVNISRSSAFRRGDGTFAAVRREMAEARASRSVTRLFEHRSVGRHSCPQKRRAHRWCSLDLLAWLTLHAGEPPAPHAPYTAVVASAFSFSD